MTSSAFSIFSVYNLLLVTTRQVSIDQRTSGKFCFRWRTFDKSPLRSKRNVSSFYVLLRAHRRSVRWCQQTRMFLLLLPDYPFECVRIDSTRLDQQVIIGWVLGLSDKSSETSSCAFCHFTNSHVFASVFRWISQWYYHQLRPWMVQAEPPSPFSCVIVYHQPRAHQRHH